MRAAYADPPYLGCAAKHYSERHEAAAQYDAVDAHKRLIERLCDEFDAWALSLMEPLAHFGGRSAHHAHKTQVALQAHLSGVLSSAIGG